MESRLSIVTLGVSDLKRSEEFYINKFGWHKSDASNENICFIELNGIFLALFPEENLAEDASVNNEGSGFRKFTLAYCARTEQEVDDLFHKFKLNDVSIVRKPKKVHWGGYSGYIADPDGNLWEIAYNPFISLDKEGNMRIK